MEFYCPTCNGLLTDDGEFAGQVVICPYCQAKMTAPAPPVLPPATVEIVDEPQSLVTVSDEKISARYSSPSEAKLALKELRLLKKKLALLKREVNIKQRTIRADYTDDIRHRGSKVHGGGMFGELLRIGQTVSRDMRRAALADALKPLEAEKKRIEHLAIALDSVILQVQAYLLSA